INALLNFVYPLPAGSTQPPPPQYFLDRTILCARNSDVDDVNARMLDRLPGAAQVFHSAD
ncbi:hypothetical protein C8Q76DRAFT_602778, partial [Earliella scabrosa]